MGHTCHNILVLTLLLPRALLEMLESLLATISTSLAKIPMQVELSSPERQLGEGVYKLDSRSPKVSMARVRKGRGYSHHGEGIQSQMHGSAWFTGLQTHSSLCSPPSMGMINQVPKLQIQAKPLSLSSALILHANSVWLSAPSYPRASSGGAAEAAGPYLPPSHDFS